MKIVRGKAFVYASNIDTDQIYPGRYLELTDPVEIGQHCLEGVDPGFRLTFQPGDIIVASTNFGCGSSREHAAIALKTVGVGAILAESFGRIFYRNAINLGIPLMVCKGIGSLVNNGDLLSVDILTGTVRNETTGTAIQGESLLGYALNIIESGGIKELIKNQRRGNADQ
jgi:3-isopropylmalate/(R)-2-methylmalate dehydratase small subunit